MSFSRALVALGIGLATVLVAGTAGAQQKTKVVFWNYDTNAAQRAFWAEQVQRFEAANPTIDLEHVTHPTQNYDAALELAIRSGSLPDVFDTRDGQTQIFKSGTRASDLGVRPDVVQPIDRFVNDAWFARFGGRGNLLDGLHRFGGKLYTYPYRDERINGMRVVVFYNKDLLAQAGITEYPRTWAEMRAAARAVTETSKGQAYGALMSYLQSGTENTVGAFAAAAGATTAGVLGGPELRSMNLQTGRYAMTAQPFVKTVDFLRSLVTDGSMLPGFETTTNDQGVALFLQGRVAMLMGPGFWAAPVIDGAKPRFAWDLALPPSIDGRARPLHVVPALGRVFMSAKTRNPDAAWKWMDFITSVPFAQAMVEAGFSYPFQPAAYQGADVAPYARKIIDTAQSSVVLAPNPRVRSELSTLAFSQLKVPQPNDLAIWRAAIAGKTNYAQAAAAFDATMNAQLDQAVAVLAAANPGVTRARLFSFPNWIPTRSFERADY